MTLDKGMPSEIITVHYEKDGECFEARYARYVQPDGSVKDYKIYGSEWKCRCPDLKRG